MGLGYSFTAGVAGGLVECAFNYPFIFAQARLQLDNLDRKQGKGAKLPPFGREWYVGCSTVMVGNALKAGIRFVSFDKFKKLLSDADGKITGPRTALAGLGAGIMESTLAVTPFESIKTSLIDDRKRPQPKYKGFVHGTRMIVAERGIRGIYQGLTPTMMRQAANSAIRFWSYSSIKHGAEAHLNPGEKLGTISTFGIGAMAGLITVSTTMPLDVLKTRMQSIQAKKLYKSTFDCAYKISTQEGILAFWAGTTPRLGRLVLSGGIVFTVYEKMMDLFEAFDPQARKK
ncbi:putative mitochondrial carrier [Neolecta irregularis DAH-3]|uniref:Putative mitochondrial carrier n=1 Tax=Neolecta irregularis (strain DAH-3) TaxID=1198029 RepID=A0A1U7LHQ0_NEOID|nr:putative mitochondrial carrier [Neolecta irregularis DAH-3]|eukprot:OLL22174.1 putative mitochondrial carrier [Neolecta irregularis DAH-3]